MSRFTRKTVLALTTIASLGMIALTTDDASARLGGGGGGMRAHGGGHGVHGGGGMRRIGGGGGMRRIDPRFGRPRLHPHPRFGHRHPHWHWRWGWRRPYWVAPVVTTAVATRYVAPTWNRCSCLTKEYTPEGAVVFKDLCTKEIAMNPPAPQPTTYAPALDPAMQANLQPPTQAAPLAQPVPQAALPQASVPPAPLPQAR